MIMKVILANIITVILTSINVNCQIVNIPDPVFKAYLVNNTAINTNLDTEIQVTEANIYPGSINVSGLGISSMNGIEQFVALSSLNCDFNSIGNIDITNLTQLETFYCNACGLSSVDISFNTALKWFGVWNNTMLTTLDISNNTELRTLQFSNCQISNIDLSNNQLLWMIAANDNLINNIDVSSLDSLKNLIISNNPISSLDVSMNSILNELSAYGTNMTSLNVANGNNINFNYFVADNNPFLECINVDDAAWSTVNWTNIDATASFSENCLWLGTEENKVPVLNIVPNPSCGRFKIVGFEQWNKSIYYSLSDFMGNEIIEKSVYNGDYLELNLKGGYIISIFDSNSLIVREKIVFQ